jgi:hypothetical protein
MHTCIHALQLQLQLNYSYSANGRRAPRHQEREAQRPRATLTYNYTTVGPTRRPEHRRARGGIERDTRWTGGHKGGSKRHWTPGGPSGKHRGIGAGRKARGIQHTRAGAANVRARPGTSVTFIEGGPPGYFIHISITTPIVSALKKLL